MNRKTKARAANTGSIPKNYKKNIEDSRVNYITTRSTQRQVRFNVVTPRPRKIELQRCFCCDRRRSRKLFLLSNIVCRQCLEVIHNKGRVGSTNAKERILNKIHRHLSGVFGK